MGFGRTELRRGLDTPLFSKLIFYPWFKLKELGSWRDPSGGVCNIRDGPLSSLPCLAIT